ncbi:MAG: hypothetical protein KC591_01070, partial [Gemmatimonadetes bacterium]|nr:hypothetical protein [Gemmatimonadota bacterium]
PADPSAPPATFHPVVRDIYVRRLGSADAADRFLHASDPYPEPSALANLEAAADRILAAVARNERIAVFGHDDPDGITSCAILVETLERLDADVDPYIPARATEGHGLYPDLIRRFQHRGARLLVTTDGCSSNVEEVELARSLRLDVIVTDHHEVAAGRAAVPGLVNPKAEKDSPLTDLTGAGVAALLARQILRRAWPGDTDGADKFCCRHLDLVALGSICDWADLGRNNRSWVVEGLSRVARGDRPALSILRRALEIGPDAVFRVGKASRLGAAFASVPSSDGQSPGLRALLGRPSWAGDLEDVLKTFLRQEAELERALAVGREAAEALGIPAGEPAVMFVTDVNSRWLGRVATALVESTGRPAAVLTEHRGSVVGELRAPEGVHLVDVLAEMKELLASWGGHRVAAGFSADGGHAPEIQRRLRSAFAGLSTPAPAPPVTDAEIRRADVDLAFSRALRAAMPFGKGNPAPIFRVRDFRRGGTAMEFDSRDGVGVRLFESGFPDRFESYDPLVTFQPRGGGGLTVKFLDWAR